MGSPDGNQDTNETPDLTNNTAAVDINKDAQKVKKYAGRYISPSMQYVNKKINKWGL